MAVSQQGMAASLIQMPARSSAPADHWAEIRQRPVIVSSMSTPDHAQSDHFHQELAALAQQLDRLLDTVRRLTE
jgi:cell division protein ZapB